MVSRSGKNRASFRSFFIKDAKRDTAKNLKRRHSTSFEPSCKERKELKQLSQVQASAATAPPIDVKRHTIADSLPLNHLTMAVKSDEPDLAMLEKMQPFASVVNFLYSNLEAQIPYGWTQVKPTKDQVQQFTNNIKGIIIASNGDFITKAGLVARLFITDNAQLCLAFDDSVAAEVSIKSIRQSGSFSKATYRWFASAKDALSGRKSKLYKQAANLVSILTKAQELSFDATKVNPLELYDREVASLPAFETRGITLSAPQITLTGHASGASLAQYAAVAVGTIGSPIHCYGFCCAEIGTEIQQEIEKKTQHDLTKHRALVSKIINLKIKGDFVTDKYSYLGESFTIAPLAEKEPDISPSVDAHINFFNHLNVNIAIKKNHTKRSTR